MEYISMAGFEKSAILRGIVLCRMYIMVHSEVSKKICGMYSTKHTVLQWRCITYHLYIHVPTSTVSPAPNPTFYCFSWLWYVCMHICCETRNSIKLSPVLHGRADSRSHFTRHHSIQASKL